VIAMGNWNASKKRLLMRKRGIEYAKSGDRSSMVRRTLPERSANAVPPKSNEELRADAAAAFLQWRANLLARRAAE
jgi:hypothetical protein